MLLSIRTLWPHPAQHPALKPWRQLPCLVPFPSFSALVALASLDCCSSTPATLPASSITLCEMSAPSSLPSQSSLPYLQPATAPSSPNRPDRSPPSGSVSSHSARQDPQFSSLALNIDDQVWVAHRGALADGPAQGFRREIKRKHAPPHLILQSERDDGVRGEAAANAEAETSPQSFSGFVGMAGVGCGTTHLGQIVSDHAVKEHTVASTSSTMADLAASPGRPHAISSRVDDHGPAAALPSALSPTLPSAPIFSSPSSTIPASPISPAITATFALRPRSFSPLHPPQIPLPPVPTRGSPSPFSPSHLLASPFQSPLSATLTPHLSRQSSSASLKPLRPASPAFNPPPRPPPSIPLPTLPQGPSGFRDVSDVPRSPTGIFAHRNKSTVVAEVNQGFSSGDRRPSQAVVQYPQEGMLASPSWNIDDTQQHIASAGLISHSISFSRLRFQSMDTSLANSTQRLGPQTW